MLLLKILDIVKVVDSALIIKIHTSNRKHSQHKALNCMQNEVRKHTESFQVLQVQFKQQERNRKFLGQDLSIINLYLLHRLYEGQKEEICLPMKKKSVSDLYYFSSERTTRKDNNLILKLTMTVIVKSLL